MRKIKLCLAIILTLILLLTSCDIFYIDTGHEPKCFVHVWSDYKYNERVHWREYTCGCPWPEIVEEHINFDEDLICDVCGAYCGFQHIDEDKNEVCDKCGLEYVILIWNYTEERHWMTYKSLVGSPVPDEVINEGEHSDEDKDGFCDMCKYIYK